ncbi:TIGR02391 family protein [Streptomyces sp. NPDC093089]|uniref:TIGR02391 family protein n=1 Tax=Streptomyces sp. NPDC093089 TaxID=3366024 RepID=UPI0037F7C06C
MKPIAKPDWAVEQLTRFLTLIEGYGSPTGRGPYVAGTIPTDEEIFEQAHIVEQIFEHVEPEWRELLTLSYNPAKRWEGHGETAVRVRTGILHDAEIRENLGDNAPRLSASSLHPWVWDGAKSLWRSGHFREAITAAARKVNAETQNKLKLRRPSEVALFNQAFSMDAVAPGQPRLRVLPDDGSDTYRSTQRGARALAEGCYAGLRNPNSHEADLDELPEHEALEQLAAFSLLARWVDSATAEFAQ